MKGSVYVGRFCWYPFITFSSLVGIPLWRAPFENVLFVGGSFGIYVESNVFLLLAFMKGWVRTRWVVWNGKTRNIWKDGMSFRSLGVGESISFSKGGHYGGTELFFPHFCFLQSLVSTFSRSFVFQAPCCLRSYFSSVFSALSIILQLLDRRSMSFKRASKWESPALVCRWRLELTLWSGSFECFQKMQNWTVCVDPRTRLGVQKSLES